MTASVDPRLTMARLPSLFQRPLTWLTGKPLPGQEPLFDWTPMTRTLAGMLVTAAGVVLSLMAVHDGGFAWLLVVPGLLLASGGMRALYLEIAHNAVHGWWSPTHWVNVLVTEWFTIVTLTNGYHVFWEQHLKNHHGRNGTLDDPDYAALLAWGIVPGMDRDQLRRRARWLIFNPLAHLHYLWGRLHDTFFAGPAYRRALAVAWNGGLVATVAATGLWFEFVIAWLLPLGWGFQASSMLQMVAGEHAWGLDLPRGKERVQQLTYGRFLGDAYPERGGAAKLRWWVRLFGLHLPAKFWVFVGNDIGPAHDVHHRIPSFDWSNAAYAREKLIAEGRLPGATDVWGSLGELVDYAVDGMAKSPTPDSRVR